MACRPQLDPFLVVAVRGPAPPSIPWLRHPPRCATDLGATCVAAGVARHGFDLQFTR